MEKYRKLIGISYRERHIERLAGSEVKQTLNELAE